MAFTSPLPLLTCSLRLRDCGVSTGAWVYVGSRGLKFRVRFEYPSLAFCVDLRSESPLQACSCHLLKAPSSVLGWNLAPTFPWDFSSPTVQDQSLGPSRLFRLPHPLWDCQLLFEVEIIRIPLWSSILLITYLLRDMWASHKISRASLCLEICRLKI